MGRRPWRCRCGLPYWWPPVLADAVAVRRGGVRPCGWCTGWRSLPLASVRRAGGRSVAGVRPWPWWPFSWPLAAFRPSAGPLVRRGPFVARGGPFGPCVLALSFGSIPSPLAPVAAGLRWWCLRAYVAPSVVAVAVSLAVLAGVAGVGVVAPCRGPWSVSLAASMSAVWRCASGVFAPCLVGSCAVSVRPCWCPPWSVAVRPSVLAGVLVCGRWLVSVSCRIPWPWRPVWAVGGVGVRRWSLRPVWALLAGWPCGPCQWWRRWWLAVLALAVVLAYFKERRPVAGWRWAVCGAFRGGVRLPCLWWSLLVSRQRRPWAVRLSKDQNQRPPWRPCWWCGLLVRAGVGGAGVGGYVLTPVGPRAAAVGRRAVGVTY